MPTPILTTTFQPTQTPNRPFPPKTTPQPLATLHQSSLYPKCPVFTLSQVPSQDYYHSYKFPHHHHVCHYSPPQQIYPAAAHVAATIATAAATYPSPNP